MRGHNKNDSKLTLTGELVNFLKLESGMSLESIAKQLGIARSTLNYYLDKTEKDTLKNNFFDSLERLLKLCLTTHEKKILQTYTQKDNFEKHRFFFNSIDISKPEDLYLLIPEDDDKYVIVFVSDYYRATDFNIIDISNEHLDFIDSSENRRQYKINETHNPKIKIIDKNSGIEINVRAMEFSWTGKSFLKSLKEKSRIDGIYLAKTNKNATISGKVIIQKETEYNDQGRLNLILNREGNTPFISSQSIHEIPSERFNGIYNNFFYIPTGKDPAYDYDRVGVNIYLFNNGKIYGIAQRSEHKYYVGSYYHHHDKLWIETYHTNSQFKISSNFNDNLFALKSIVKPADPKNTILKGNFLGYSAQNYSISGFDFFYKQSELDKRSFNTNEIVRTLKELEPTFISLYYNDKRNNTNTPKNFSSLRTNKQFVEQLGDYEFFLENSNKSIHDYKGFTQFLKFYFKYLNQIKEN